MKKLNIVILDGYSANPGDLSWDGLKEYGNVTVYDRTEKNDIIARAKDADVILTNKVGINAEIMVQLPQLKMISVLATGFNIIDIKAARERGIDVCNIPAYSTNSVVQMVFAHIFALTNRVEHYANDNREGRWAANSDFCYWDTPMHEIAGKTLGIVGLGNIGTKVAAVARAFGMDVYAFTSKNASDLPAGIQKTTMDGLLGVSDILTLHCPLNADTRELINKQTLAKMKQGALLINTGRGPLVNEQDVAESLKEGHLGGYGADVMCQEPPTADNPLLSCPNANITPHVAWATFEARQRLLNITVENIKAFAAGAPQNVVNA